MASTINGIFCGIPAGGYALNYTCTGPSCTLAGNLTGLPMTCTTEMGVLSCSNGNNCTGSNFTNNFILSIDDNGVLSASDMFDVTGKQSDLVSNYTSNGTTTSNSTGGPATTTGSSPAASTSKSAGHRSRAIPPLFTIFTFGFLALLFLPAVAASALTYSFNDPESTDLISLEARANANGVREVFTLTASAQKIVLVGSDVLLAAAKDDGKPKVDANKAAQEIFDTLRNSLLPPVSNIGIDILEANPEAAAKDAMKAVGEKLLDAALVELAPETFGASLLVLLISHVAVDIAVDELFKGAHVLYEFAQNATEGHGANGGMACDSGNYSASPWFFYGTEFGTDEWRECKSCCVAWGQVLYASTNGVCGCCTLQVQFDDPSLNCCSDDYFSKCCKVDC